MAGTKDRPAEELTPRHLREQEELEARIDEIEKKKEDMRQLAEESRFVAIRNLEIAAEYETMGRQNPGVHQVVESMHAGANDGGMVTFVRRRPSNASVFPHKSRDRYALNLRECFPYRGVLFP